MTFKKGDLVRLKKDRQHEIRPEALNDVIGLSTCGVFTIKKKHPASIGERTYYLAEEFKTEWAWRGDQIEKIKKIEIFEPIDSRFEILDL